MSGYEVPDATQAKLDTLQSDMTTLKASVAALSFPAVKSLQTGYIASNSSPSLGSGEDARYFDTTVSSVDTAKTAILWWPGPNASQSFLPRLTSSTNFRLASPKATSMTVEGRYQLVEFY